MVGMTKKVKTFEVIFSDPSKEFYCSGDKVAGKIVVEVTEVTRVSRVKVEGVGCAKVQYTKWKHRCHEELEYLKHYEKLHLDDHPVDTDGSVILRPGMKYEYTFGFQLPQEGQLVSSYKGKFGYVQYFVKASMERPGHPVMECKKFFEVEEPLDVKTPDLVVPTSGMKKKKVTCMFIPDGQVSLNAKIDHRGYYEGEEICIDAKFENACSRIVVPKAAIVTKHTYQANGRTKLCRQKLSSVRGNHIISGMCDAWQGKTIRVPKIKPSILGCDILRVEYALMIYVLIPGSHKVTLELPLVIGSSSGFSSRTSSMISQDSQDSTQSSSLISTSWESLPMPSPPSSYSDSQLESPLTPLLDYHESGLGPVFTTMPVHLPPSF